MVEYSSISLPRAGRIERKCEKMKLTTQYKEYLPQIKRLYRDAFPRDERMPFFLITRECKKGGAELIAVVSDSGRFGGFAVTMRVGDIVMLSYFAISPRLRDRGIGSRVIRSLMRRFKDERFILEIEDVTEPCPDPETRRRRREFYLRNGMISAGFTAHVFMSDLEVLTSGKPVTFEEYRALYRSRRGGRVALKVTLKSQKSA